MRINTNVNALISHKNMTRVDKGLSSSLEKLSSGLRVNRASDDAGGLAISESLRTQVRGIGQAEKNAQDGISLLNVAEGVLAEMHNVMQRLRELAVQASNGTLQDTPDRAALNTEFNELFAEITRIPFVTKFNGVTLFDSVAPLTLTLQVGANNGEQLAITTPQIDPSTLFTIAGPGFVDTQANAELTIGYVTDAINIISASRAQIGAQVNRLEYTLANLTTTRENLASAESRIRDTDMASEMTVLTRQQILMQSSTAMLAQANAQPQTILSLFQ